MINFRAEDAKKLLFSINEQFPHYVTNPKLEEPIKKLQYNIKTALKKVQNIQENLNVNVNPGISKTTLKKRKFSDITPLEKNLRFMAPDFNNLKSHPGDTLVTTKAT